MRLAKALPWTDRQGRPVPLKAVTFALALLPALVLAAEWSTLGLGAEPWKAATHVLGLWTIRFLLITLAVSPARSLYGWPQLMQVRRMLGLTALAYGVVHLGFYCAMENFAALHVASEIVSRVYLMIGFAALLGLVALGFTSTDGWMRSLGRNWKRLHRLAYPIATLGLLHYFMQSKANVSEAAFTAGLFFWLMLWRLIAQEWQRREAALLALSLGAAVLTALVEAGWYLVATRVPASRVLEANWNPVFGLRPGAWVLVATLAIPASVLLWRRVRPPPTDRRAARQFRAVAGQSSA